MRIKQDHLLRQQCSSPSSKTDHNEVDWRRRSVSESALHVCDGYLPSNQPTFREQMSEPPTKEDNNTEQTEKTDTDKSVSDESATTGRFTVFQHLKHAHQTTHSRFTSNAPHTMEDVRSVISHQLTYLKDRDAREKEKQQRILERRREYREALKPTPLTPEQEKRFKQLLEAKRKIDRIKKEKKDIGTNKLPLKVEQSDYPLASPIFLLVLSFLVFYADGPLYRYLTSPLPSKICEQIFIFALTITLMAIYGALFGAVIYTSFLHAFYILEHSSSTTGRVLSEGKKLYSQIVRVGTIYISLLIPVAISVILASLEGLHFLLKRKDIAEEIVTEFESNSTFFKLISRINPCNIEELSNQCRALRDYTFEKTTNQKSFIWRSNHLAYVIWNSVLQKLSFILDGVITSNWRKLSLDTSKLVLSYCGAFLVISVIILHFTILPNNKKKKSKSPANKNLIYEQDLIVTEGHQEEAKQLIVEESYADDISALSSDNEDISSTRNSSELRRNPFPPKSIIKGKIRIFKKNPPRIPEEKELDNVNGVDATAMNGQLYQAHLSPTRKIKKILCSRMNMKRLTRLRKKKNNMDGVSVTSSLDSLSVQSEAVVRPHDAMIDNWKKSVHNSSPDLFQEESSLSD